MEEMDPQTAASQIRRNYDLCTDAILSRDPDAFIAAFGPTARGETAEGVPITLAETYDYWAWRFGRTVTAHDFTVTFDNVEVLEDGVWIQFTEDSAATVLDSDDEPVLRTAHGVNRVLWRREEGEWNQVGGSELEVRRTVGGLAVTPNDDPVGIPAYRAQRAGTA